MNIRRERKRCVPCGGSGKVLGGGMVQSNCDYCDGSGKQETIDDMDYLLEKGSERYNDAVNRIKDLSGDITTERAEELLDTELKKDSEEKPKRKKREKVHE